MIKYNIQTVTFFGTRLSKKKITKTSHNCFFNLNDVTCLTFLCKHTIMVYVKHTDFNSLKFLKDKNKIFNFVGTSN